MDDKNLVAHRASTGREILKDSLIGFVLKVCTKIPFYLPFIALIILGFAPEAPIAFFKDTIILPQNTLSVSSLNQYNNLVIFTLTWALTLYTLLAIKGKLCEAMLTFKNSSSSLRTAFYSGFIAFAFCFSVFTPLKQAFVEKSAIQTQVDLGNYDLAISKTQTKYKDELQRNYVISQILVAQQNHTPLSSSNQKALSSSLAYMKEFRTVAVREHWANISVVEGLANNGSFKNIDVARYSIFSILTFNLLLIIFLKRKKRVL